MLGTEQVNFFILNLSSSFRELNPHGRIELKGIRGAKKLPVYALLGGPVSVWIKKLNSFRWNQNSLAEIFRICTSNFWAGVPDQPDLEETGLGQKWPFSLKSISSLTFCLTDTWHTFLNASKNSGFKICASFLIIEWHILDTNAGKQLSSGSTYV